MIESISLNRHLLPRVSVVSSDKVLDDTFWLNLCSILGDRQQNYKDLMGIEIHPSWIKVSYRHVDGSWSGHMFNQDAPQFIEAMKFINENLEVVVRVKEKS